MSKLSRVSRCRNRKLQSLNPGQPSSEGDTHDDSTPSVKMTRIQDSDTCSKGSFHWHDETFTLFDISKVSLQHMGLYVTRDGG